MFHRITEILADGRFHGVHDAAAQGVADVDLLACNCDMHWSDSFLSAAPERGTLVCTGHAAKPSGFISEEHTSELQSLMRISYAVFCLKKKKKQSNTVPIHQT